MQDYEDIWYHSEDGLRLYARDYVCKGAPLTLLCMHGLTRNSADFEPLCEYLAPDYRMIVVDQRGRGKSERDIEPANYHPATYVQDMFRLIDTLQLTNLVLVGTSLGGLMAMIMNALRPGAFKAVVINDIGPVVEPEGLERIKKYVGKIPPAKSWDEAVANIRRLNEQAFPHFQLADWQQFTRRLYAENDQGIPELLYDPAIFLPLAADEGNAVPPDLWPAFEQLRDVPTLLIRGALSDILSAETSAEMLRRKPDLQFVEIADVGHAPILDEPAVVQAISCFLEDVKTS